MLKEVSKLLSLKGSIQMEALDCFTIMTFTHNNLNYFPHTVNKCAVTEWWFNLKPLHKSFDSRCSVSIGGKVFYTYTSDSVFYVIKNGTFRNKDHMKPIESPIREKLTALKHHFSSKKCSAKKTSQQLLLRNKDVSKVN